MFNLRFNNILLKSNKNSRIVNKSFHHIMTKNNLPFYCNSNLIITNKYKGKLSSFLTKRNFFLKISNLTMSSRSNLINCPKSDFLIKNSKKGFSSGTEVFMDEILLTEDEALLMNEHDRICILLTNNSIAKENITNFMNELMTICIKLKRLSNYMQGWDILKKFVSQNLINFNDTDFLKYIQALGNIISPNDNIFWKNVANNMLNRNLKSEDIVKVLLIICKYDQDKYFYERIADKVKDYKLFCEAKDRNSQIDDNEETLNLSNSLVLLYVLSQNLINEKYYKEENNSLKNFVDDVIIKKTIALLVTENFIDNSNKKDLVILLKICGNIFNYKVFRESISTKPLDDFIQQIVLYVNKIKGDPKNQNLIVMLFVMLKNIEYLYEKNHKLFENLVLAISENYRVTNDLLKYAFYLELLDLFSSNQNMNKLLTEKSVKSANSVNEFYFIKQLVIPNEEFLEQYIKINKQLKGETSIQNIIKIKQDFFKKYYREIGITKDKVQEFAENNYAVVNCLNFIFG